VSYKESICLVKGYGGEYGDAYEYNIKAFRDDVAAEVFVKDLRLLKEQYNEMVKDNGWVRQLPPPCRDHAEWQAAKAKRVADRATKLLEAGYDQRVVDLLGDDWHPPHGIMDDYDIEVIELV